MVPGTPPGSETQNARNVPFLLSEIKIKGTVPLFLSFIFRCQVRDGEGQGQDTEIDNFFFFFGGKESLLYFGGWQPGGWLLSKG